MTRRNFRIQSDYWITEKGEALKAINPKTNIHGHAQSAIYHIVKENLETLQIANIYLGDDLRTIENKLKNNTKELNLPQDVLSVLTFKLSPTEYMIKNKGWIRINGNSVDTYGYNQTKQEQLAKGLKQIITMEKIPEHANIPIDIWNNETKRSISTNTNKIFSQEISPRTNDIIDNKEDNKFFHYQQQHPHKSKISKTKSALTQQGILPPGHEPWRGTSESFSQWLENNSQ